MSQPYHDSVLDACNRDPVDVLVEDPDPMHRSRAHTALGLKAMQREDTDLAVFHLREAIDLDPTDETPRDALRALGQSGAPSTTEGARTGLFGRIWSGLRRGR